MERLKDTFIKIKRKNNNILIKLSPNKYYFY